MLKVGELYIPNDAFDKILHSHISAAAKEVLGCVGNKLPDNVREQLETLTVDPYPHASDYFYALVRLQTENFTQHDGYLEQTETFQVAIHEFRVQADQTIYQMFPPEVKADQNIIDSLSLSQEVLLGERT